MSKVAIHWFRRDLRLEDNRALYKALSSDLPVVPVFIFDKHILNELPEDDARVTFIHREVKAIQKKLQENGKDLRVYYGTPEEVYGQISEDMNVGAVYFNRDYEPYATDRDRKITELLEEKGIEVHTFKDHVIFEKDEVLKSDGDPYVVFTPYKKTWLERLKDDKKALHHYESESKTDGLLDLSPSKIPSLKDMGFIPSGIEFPEREVKRSVIENYDKTRNIPSLEDGTSRLGIHFRFGTISIRDKARKAKDLNDTYLSELIWRDFYSQILAHFPRVVSESFRSKYDAIKWRNNEKEFALWCKGKTGFPLVDAGMRELNSTGYMHNRVRMLTASFLTKHLLIDWRWGEAYFAEKLLDYDLASNNGGWQWAAGSGTDAAPYFRIFNPSTQLEKFDKDRTYVRRFVEEYGTDEYPDPMVDHKEARQRCLNTYKQALDN